MAPTPRPASARGRIQHAEARAAETMEPAYENNDLISRFLLVRRKSLGGKKDHAVAQSFPPAVGQDGLFDLLQRNLAWNVPHGEAVPRQVELDFFYSRQP
jgi:hypothetical protein